MRHKKQFAAFKKVRGKARLLFRMAEASVDQLDGVIKEVLTCWYCTGQSIRETLWTPLGTE